MLREPNNSWLFLMGYNLFCYEALEESVEINRE